MNRDSLNSEGDNLSSQASVNRRDYTNTNIGASNAEQDPFSVSSFPPKKRDFTLWAAIGLAVSTLVLLSTVSRPDHIHDLEAKGDYFPGAADDTNLISELGATDEDNSRVRGELHELHAGIAAVVSNEYTHIGYDMFPYPFLDQALLMEPLRENTVTMKGLPTDTSCKYSWRFLGVGTNTSGLISGGQYVIVPNATGNYQLVVIVSCYVDKRISDFTWNQETVVKYVRRDILTLTDDDREEFLDAFRTLWDVSTEDGKLIYGENYKSVYYFAAIHNDAGANPVCDEFHGDVGFVHNHLYLGAFLEQSLQLVNPRTSLHYWEYSRTFDYNSLTQHSTRMEDSDIYLHVKNQLDGGGWTSLLSSKWFGSVDPMSGEILDGRWAHTIVPRVDHDFFLQHGVGKDHFFFPDDKKKWMELGPAHISSAFGLLRAPWNFSPSNSTLRFNNVVRIADVENFTVGNASWTFLQYMGSTCHNLKDLIEQSAVGQPLSTFLLNVDGPAHGSIHYALGGVGGQHAVDVDAILRDEFGLSNQDIATISFGSSNFMKTWLSGSVIGDSVNPLNCTEYPWDVNTETLTNDEDVTCELNEYYLKDETHADSLLALLFFGVESSPSGDPSSAYSLIKNLTFSRKQKALRLIASRMQCDGDMAQSSSAVDPFFWVAHGAVERIVQRVFFENVLTDKIYQTEGNRCQGHNENGTAHYLKGFKFTDQSIEPSNLTNRVLLSLLDPTAAAYGELLSFVYDNSQFQWCGSDERVAAWFAQS